MTDEFEEWEPREQAAWTPKTPRDEREPLNSAPLANLGATPSSEKAFLLMDDLAERYQRPQSAKGNGYARKKTLVQYANAGGAFIAELLAAVEADRSEGWIRCSHRKSDYTGKDVSWAMFDGVRKAWLEAGLIEHKPGFHRKRPMNHSGPASGKLTRYRATPKLLEIAAAHGITPANVLEHFKFEFRMPPELIQLTQPFELTPNTERVAKLRAQIAELNAFSAKHTLTHPTRTVKHLGWVRMFHGYSEGFKYDKGGRLYSQPQGAPCYQSVSSSARAELRIDGERVVELDISSSFLTIFYALCDEQLDQDQDAYAGILGHTDLDRLVAKFWVNVSLSNGALLTKWTTGLIESLQGQLTRKELTGFSKKAYPMTLIRKKVLERHPLLHRWGGLIRGRTLSWADLMYRESEAIIGAMLTLKRDHDTPSYPVHDSLIVPVSKYKVAREALIHHFRVQTGKVPRVKPEVDPEDW
ncbi:hypothetical protein [Bradyrhizobium canariense]|uniref:hypothetical protein n=1 Tax=Bradyrhizobium canariense TaxID=255045 RepID=UPI000A1984B7|nr:hypothetical protein [Bradyrhizobium canariense]OSI23101.1 hypothetical protein BST65_24320 [Bradyrhizobium canariense]OSI37238.1 hypothetical protein BST66_04125 [Bradyrhizobium canariense]OSI38265.1 hypothetical protein BSZ20_35450 [Bradyrhizobium canariense]OSI46612.1 hypothetical protein BST67_22700 [Bradyrhizobium canariense]OSI59472.1 hypothetical protein BSZ15_04605 [Bradyrhizobium canariense]